MILACQNIEKSFGGMNLIHDASFHIEEREKAALVGINGAGKSTLLRIIMQEIPADSGEVILSRGRTIGYLAQHQELDSALTIYDSLLQVKQHILDMELHMRRTEKQMKHAQGEELDRLMETYSRLTHEFEMENGYAYKSELVGVLKGLGFPESDFEKEISTLSGGQKTRVALGRLLLSKPDIILLDEPTNHLDMDSISWLETYLLNYPGAVLIVSHDRYFLDRIVTKVIDIDNGKVSSFSGNYSAYSEKKAQLRRDAYQAYLNQQQEIKHQEEVIAKLKQFNREKSIKRAESREKMLDKIEVIEKPTEVNASMRIYLKPRIESGMDVLTVEHLSKSFPSLPLFSDLNFSIKRGERVAIIGNNGTGKTTILKILNELVPADAGGERGRVSLAKLMLSEANFLILDEPTNHLDIMSKEILEEALRNYTGTVLYVSHDRYFINRTATRILELTNQSMVNYIGNYDYYMEKREELTRIYAPGLEEEQAAESVSATKLDWKQRKEEQARQRKRENDLKKTEAEIERLETRDKEIDSEMEKPEVAVNVAECVRLANEKAEIAEKLEELYEKWEELA